MIADWYKCFDRQVLMAVKSCVDLASHGGCVDQEQCGMYQSFFQFGRRPFNATPEARDFFPSEPIENARQTLTRCIERGEGPALLIGPVGTGKTLLCQVLAEQLKENYKIALLASGQLCSRRTLLQAILFELGLPYRDLEEGELRLSLIDHLAPSDLCPNGMLLIVDESQTLPLRLLEEIRMITNLVRGGRPRVRLVLAGGPFLEERFASPKLESFSQRLAARCYLDSLRREETFDYIRHQLAEIAGDHQQETFTDAALGAVYDATDGIPRLINQVCDHALIMAAIGHRRQLDAAGIQEAWADLQQLPTPWSDAPTAGEAEADGGIIEFGQLDEQPGDHPQARTQRTGRAGGDTPATAASLLPEDSAFQDVDPTAQLEDVQQQIAQLDVVAAELESSDDATELGQQYYPVGSIGPEIELTFPGLRDPFAEHFDVEEVVVDRCALSTTEVVAERPTAVPDGGGRNRLAAAATSTTGETSRQRGAAQRTETDVVVQSPPDKGPEPRVVTPAPSQAVVQPTADDAAAATSGIDPPNDPVMPEYRSESTLDAWAAGEPNSVSVLETPPAVGHDNRPTSEPDVVEPENGEMIAATEEPDSAVAAARPAGTQHGQSYRKLFSTLRRGRSGQT